MLILFMMIKPVLIYSCSCLPYKTMGPQVISMASLAGNDLQGVVAVVLGKEEVLRAHEVGAETETLMMTIIGAEVVEDLGVRVVGHDSQEVIMMIGLLVVDEKASQPPGIGKYPALVLSNSFSWSDHH